MCLHYDYVFPSFNSLSYFPGENVTKDAWKTQWTIMLLISIKGKFFLLKFSSHTDPEFLLREISQSIFLFIYWKKSIGIEFRFPLKQEKEILI